MIPLIEKASVQEIKQFQEEKQLIIFQSQKISS